MSDIRNVDNNLPEIPKWITLEKKLNCSKCETKCKCNHKYNYTPKKPKTLLDCKKKANLIFFFINTVSVIPIYFAYRKIYYAFSGKLFLTIFVMSVILFLYDIIFLLIENKIILPYFKHKEKVRQIKHEEKVKEIEYEREKIQKEQEEKEKLEFKGSKEVIPMYDILSNLSEEDKKAISSFENEYLDMLKELNQLCKDLDLKISELDSSTKNFFKVYLPEFVKTCEQFLFQYKTGLLNAKEIIEFHKLIQLSTKKFQRVHKNIWRKENIELTANIETLNETFSKKENESED